MVEELGKDRGVGERDTAVESTDGRDVYGFRCQKAIDQVDITWAIGGRWEVNRKLGNDLICHQVNAGRTLSDRAIYLIPRQVVSQEVLRPGRNVSAAQALVVPDSGESPSPSRKAQICRSSTRCSSCFYGHGQGRVVAI